MVKSESNHEGAQSSGVYIGVDPSWTGLAVTALDGEREVLRAEVIRTKPGDFESQSARLSGIGDQFGDLIYFNAFEKSATVAIEGYAMGSKTRPQMAGELGGQLKLKLWLMGVTYIIVPPSSLKKYVFGSGNAKKNAMMMQVYKRWGYESAGDDACDAYCLARIAHEYAAGNWTKVFSVLVGKCEVVESKTS